MYCKRMKCSKKLANMRARKEEIRLNSDAPDYPHELPALRRQIIIKDFDFGEVVEQVDLYRSPRIDCYTAVINGRIWKRRIGWSRILRGIGKSFPRVQRI